MLVFRGSRTYGLGETPATPAPLTEGYCLKNGIWMWTTADQCAQPLQPGGAPIDKPGFCWVRQSPPKAFPGYWTRPRVGQTSCAFEPPPSPPSGSAGPVVREHRVERGGTPGGGRIVTAGPTTGAMTRAMVDRLYTATVKNYFEREALALKAWTLTRAPCPPESAKPPACKGCLPGCYTFGPITMAQTIPGGFEMYGVPFNIAEPGVIKSPRFERVYTPNNEQRIFIEGAIIRRSEKLLDAALIAAARAQGAGAMSASDIRKKFIAKASVQGVLELLPRWALAVPGMAISSAPPKQDELTAPGGFEKWRKRGFLISLDVAEGRERLHDEATCPRACVGNSCRCGDNPTPACIGAGVPTADADPEVSGGCFWWYAAVLADGQMKLVGVHDDPGWLERAVQPLVKFTTWLGNLTCNAQPAIQAQLTSSVAEKCVDKDGKPCERGKPGCNCISPSAATAGGVGIFNFIAGKLCQGWLADHVQDPAAALPPVPDPPPLAPATPTWAKMLPWILGGIAAGGVGAHVISRR